MTAQQSIVENTELWVVHNLNYSGLLDATYQGEDRPRSLLLYNRKAMGILWKELDDTFKEITRKNENNEYVYGSHVTFVRAVCGAPGVGKYISVCY